MRKTDLIFNFGLALVVVGFGGGYELSVWGYSRAFLNNAAAMGAADPATLSRAIGESSRYLLFGAPIGLLGVVLLLVAFRNYLVHRSPADLGRDV